MSTVQVAQALLTEEREAYALYLLGWSRNPVGTPMTFDVWERRRKEGREE